MIRESNLVVKAVCKHAKRLHMSSARLLDKQEVNTLGVFVWFSEARIREVISVMPALGDKIRNV